MPEDGSYMLHEFCGRGRWCCYKLAESYLSIKKDGTHGLCVMHSNLQVFQSVLVILVGAVREIEARHIHPCSQKLLQDRNLSRLGAESAYDLCFGDVEAAVVRRIA